MFRLIFMVQALVYLLLMPAIHDYMDAVYRPPLLFSIVAVFFLSAGFVAANYLHPIQRRIAITPNQKGVLVLKPRRVVIFGISLLAMLYAYVSFSNELWNRRQGSELMAEIYGNLPLIELAILRVYEIVFIPVAVIYLFGNVTQISRFIIISILLASLPFMGIEDSRGRILVIAICLLSFVKIDSFREFFTKNIKIYGFMLFAIGAFLYVSAQRIASYARLEDYLFNEIIRRLDGLNLLSELRDFGYINLFGSFDFAMFGPLVSRISFIEAGRIAKLEGLTSTKQYYLQSVLNTNRLDDSNSVILDPLYFGGLAGLVIAFVALGYFIARFDRYVAEGKIFSSHSGLAASLAFITSFATIEVDYFGALTTFIQNFLILFPSLLLMLYSQERMPTGREGRAAFNTANDRHASGTKSLTSRAP